MGKLKDQVAVVTGASRGIGKAIALAFGNEDAKVVPTARTREAIEGVVGQLAERGKEAYAITADLHSERDLSAYTR